MTSSLLNVFLLRNNMDKILKNKHTVRMTCLQKPNMKNKPYSIHV